MTLTLVDDDVRTPGPVRTPVCAVLVTGDTLTGLTAALDALRAQTLTPEQVVILDRTTDPDATNGSHTASATLADLVRDRLGPMVHAQIVPIGETPLRKAVATVAQTLAPRADSDQHRSADDWLLWVLAAGATPTSRVLADLVDAYRRSPSVGIVAPKLVDASDASRLRSVGISSTVTGRIIDHPADNAPDQQQYDHRHDVLAVPLIGSLIEAGLVRELRGWEPTFGTVGGDLDFGWRAQRHGRRVQMAPRTTIRVVNGLGLATATTPAAARAGRRVALARASWWATPLLALWLAVSSVLGALALLLVKRPRAAFSSLSELLALDPVRVPLAWWRTRGKPTVRRADLQGLFVTGADVRRHISDQVHEALLPARHDPESSSADQRGSTAVRALTNPGLLATGLTAIVMAAAGRSLGTGFLTGLGGGPSGGELLGGRISSSALWHAWRDPWRGAGLGSDTLVGGPHLGLLAIPTWLVEHVPGLGGVGSAGGLTVGLLFVAGPLLATISAYVAARVLTPHAWLRAAGALAWAVLGPASSVYAEGRLGAVVAHVLLPAVAAGLVLLARADGTATAAWATALAAGVLGAFAPATVVLVAALSLVIVLGAPTTGAKVRALAPLVVPAALLGPWLLAVRVDPRLLLAGPGLTSWEPVDLPSWQLALLQPHGVDPQRVWLVVPVAVVLVLGLIGLVRGAAVRSLSTGLSVTAALSLAAVLVYPRVELAALPGGGESNDGVVTPWVGLPMLVLLLALLAAALWWLGQGARHPRTRGQRPVAALVLGLTALAGAAVLVITTLGDSLQTWRDPRPPVAIEHAEGDLAGRAVFISPGESGAGYRLMGREITDVARSLPVDRADDRVLAPVVAALLDGAGEDPAEDLDRYAIGIVAVAEGADAAVTRAVDATDGLTRLAARDGWNFWRVAAAGPEDHRPVAPARLDLRATGQEGELGAADVVATHGQHAATDVSLDLAGPLTLTVAEPERWVEHAEVTWLGEPVTPKVLDGHPTYALSAGKGDLVVDLVDPHRTWRVAQYLLAGAVIFLAIPFGSRASRRRS